MWGSITYFFIVTIGLGFLIDLIIKEWKADFLEKLIMRLGVGIAAFPLLGAILNLLHIPLDWKIFLLISVAIFSIAIYFRKQEILSDFKFDFSKITKNHIYSIIVLIMFAITAYMYIHGSFVYPWLENGDPYPYALASKYITLEKTYSTDTYFSHFAEPYNQGYQILMGILHQTNDSIYWTLKFFNALIISLSILFFYYFAKRFTKNRDIALFSTFALFAIPCWVGHFVFGLNLNMALFPVLLYVLSSIKENNKWNFLFMFVLASLLLIHTNTSMTIIMLVGLYYLNKVFVEENLNKNIIKSVFFGFLIALLLHLPSFIKHLNLILTTKSDIGGLEKIFTFFNVIFSNYLYLIMFLIIVAIVLVLYFKEDYWFKYIKRILQKEKIKYKIFSAVLIIILLILIVPSGKFINLRGSGTRDYTLSDFFIAQKGNMTNNPIGVGLVLMIFFTIGMLLIILNYKKLFKKENFWLSTTFIWTIVSLLITLGTYFSIMYVPFRMWTFFAIFASLIIGFSVKSLLKMIKNNPLKIALIILFVILVIPTSFSQKYWHNTAVWPEHQVMVPESQQLYVWMRDGGLPKNSMVMNICHRSSLLIGYDMLVKPWLNEELNEESKNRYFLTSLNKTIEDNYKFLKDNDFKYVMLGASCVAKYKIDANLVNNRLQEMANSTNFKLIKNTQSEFLFRVI
jgi:hypothetical protein